MRLAKLLAIISAAVASPHGNPLGHVQSLVVGTTSGEVAGWINQTNPNVRQFLGIPYAEPPLGSLRFLPPIPKAGKGPIGAKAFQPSCIQQTSTSPSVYTEILREFLISGTDSEDCLYLNVYAPLKPTSDKVPVFLYLPGGGFTSGGANSVYKFPDFWVEKEQSFIVITINYRVNLFGFPSARAQPLNVGFLDQRLAVEWARDNIAAFGGDPSRITLWGQSAGASSVGAYSYAHYKDPIVAGLIADSGGASPATPDANHTSFNKLAGYVGCGGLDAHSQLTCVQKVDARTLQTLVSTNSSVSFRPVADNLTAFANITDRAAKGLLAKIPLITGSNSNEGAGFITWNGSYTPTAQQLASAGTRITCPIVNEVANRVKHGYTTYRYEYFGNFSNISPLPWIGASHSSELPLLFGTHWEYRGNSTPFEWEVSAGMQSLWESFVTDSSKDPSGSGVRWPKHVLGQNTMIEFASNNTVFQFGSVGSVDYLCE